MRLSQNHPDQLPPIPDLEKSCSITDNRCLLSATKIGDLLHSNKQHGTFFPCAIPYNWIHGTHPYGTSSPEPSLRQDNPALLPPSHSPHPCLCLGVAQTMGIPQMLIQEIPPIPVLPVAHSQPRKMHEKKAEWILNCWQNLTGHGHLYSATWLWRADY